MGTDGVVGAWIPELVATSTNAYGGSGGLGISRRVGDWRLGLVGTAGRWNSYKAIEGFRRAEFTLRLEVTPPRWW